MIAPYSSLLTWTIAAHWYPGEKIFTSSDRNAQPARNPVGGVQTDLEPQTTGFFATDIEFDYLQPVKVGDWLCNNGNVLLSCAPKETKVGRGAFLVWESTICNQHGEEVAKMRIGTYKYNPHTTRMEAN
ncbi:FAS1-like dehydratase domain-containing protein [Salicibibacter cibarius]|uniref:FAS1-like dehydratase domain-containing protein n=1 Tax=Salicibibacter cibarius TaxID=2743000 RepID=UPI001FE5FB62|nr:MaoC family dehydratase N-terminal domain-containing protein [Salicibibacter cibarius]